MKKIFKNGRLWCSFADAAAHLHMTQKKVHEYVACGRLASTRLKRAPARYVSVTDILALENWLSSIETVRRFPLSPAVRGDEL
jgi:hypothetical protein